MAILVNCACGRPFRIKDELAGKKVRCPECKSIFTVPEPIVDAEIAYEADEIPEAAAPAPVRSAQPALAPVRKVHPIRLPDEDAPARLKADDESEEELRTKFTGRKPKKKKKKKKSSENGWLPFSVSPTIVSGVLMMIGAMVWFFAGLAAGFIFFYPPVLFIFGIIAVVKGLTGRE
jgi:F0F1-type ATP synthase assembly protein I